MKIKWRQHELVLATAMLVLISAGYIFGITQTDLLAQYSDVFKNANVPFNTYRNVIVPDTMIALSIYVAYLIINFFTVQRFLASRKFATGKPGVALSFPKTKFQGLVKTIFKKYTWVLIQLLLIFFLLGVLFDVATYLKHEWQFHYPGFSIFFNPDNPRSQLSLGAGFAAAAAMIIVYSIYLVLREFIIHKITTAKQKEYKTALCNHVTSFILWVAITLMFSNIFLLSQEQKQVLVYFFLVCCAVFAMFFSNVYWLFPMKGSRSFFRTKIIVGFLSTSFVYCIPLIFFTSILVDSFSFNKDLFFEERILYNFLLAWAIQIFIVTPLTWWYYKTNENKILQLRTVEKQLVKSKADIQFLRSQINPHFLFNVLNTLYGTALQEHAERTAEGIQKLGDMMRFMLHENNLDFIDMHKEIDYLKNYIALQKLRTQSSPDIIIEDNIHEQNCNHKIAPMLLIPLVENAFKHGISLKEKSWIKIDLNCTSTDIIFEIHNSVHTKTENDPEKERSGIGFKNVMERLKLIYGSNFQISFNKDDKEFFVKLAIQPKP